VIFAQVIFCGLATFLPSGIDMLLGNDLCPNLLAVNAVVVNRSQSAAMRRETELQTCLDSDPDVIPADVESDLVNRSAETDLTCKLDWLLVTHGRSIFSTCELFCHAFELQT